MPVSGHLTHLRTPMVSDNVRVDAGFVAGDEISPHYDPMIAKLIVRGPDRSAAIRTLRAALEEYEVAGLITNIEFLKHICRHPAFMQGDVETGFITKHHGDLFAKTTVLPEVYAQAALGVIMQDIFSQRARSGRNGIIGFAKAYQRRRLYFSTGSVVGGEGVKDIVVDLSETGDGIFDVVLGDLSYRDVRCQWNPSTLQLTSFFPHIRLDTRLIIDGSDIAVFQHGAQHQLRLSNPKWMERALGTKDLTHSVLTPMPCKVLRVEVSEGDEVKKNQVLVVIESMKMETVIRSPQDGIISKVVHKQGVSALTITRVSI